MTLQQLLEHAHLEALGQLDEHEQAAFEAAYAAAPPQVREQVRTEQARVAPMEHLLPEVEPPPDLRARVLGAVSAAMLAEQASRGELGMGRGLGMTLMSAPRVHRAWRAASIGLVTAVVVLSGAFLHVYRTNTGMNRSIESDAAGTTFLQTFNRQYMGDVLYNTATTRVLMTAIDPESTAKASMWVSPDWTTSQVFCSLPKLADNQQYRMVVMDDNGAITRTLASVAGDGLAKVFKVERLATGTHIAIVSTLINSPVSAGAKVMEAIV